MPRARVDTPQSKLKRERILNAAVQVFAAKGFHHARVSDVAREAEVADGTIYIYFKSKDDLLISLFEERMEEIVARFEANLAKLESPRDRLYRFIELHLEMVADAPSLAEVLTVELRQSAKFMREYKAPKFSEYLDLLRAIIEDGQRVGEFHPEIDANLTRRIIFGALDELSLYWVSTRRPRETLQQSLEELWRLCAGGLCFSPPPEERAP
ncbi:MAG: TetR/AcrR family transcriptional regulator [Myxococcota bacterium]|nr:TetR/AcrR family transcriptional regulator [Myxococcota bacterium]